MADFQWINRRAPRAMRHHKCAKASERSAFFWLVRIAAPAVGPMKSQMSPESFGNSHLGVGRTVRRLCRSTRSRTLSKSHSQLRRVGSGSDSAALAPLRVSRPIHGSYFGSWSQRPRRRDDPRVPDRFGTRSPGVVAPAAQLCDWGHAARSALSAPTRTRPWTGSPSGASGWANMDATKPSDGGRRASPSPCCD